MCVCTLRAGVIVAVPRSQIGYLIRLILLCVAPLALPSVWVPSDSSTYEGHLPSNMAVDQRPPIRRKILRQTAILSQRVSRPFALEIVLRGGSDRAMASARSGLDVSDTASLPQPHDEPTISERDPATPTRISSRVMRSEASGPGIFQSTRSAGPVERAAPVPAGQKRVRGRSRKTAGMHPDSRAFEEAASNNVDLETSIQTKRATNRATANAAPVGKGRQRGRGRRGERQGRGSIRGREESETVDSTAKSATDQEPSQESTSEHNNTNKVAGMSAVEQRKVEVEIVQNGEKSQETKGQQGLQEVQEKVQNEEAMCTPLRPPRVSFKDPSPVGV